jgi:hypothetical protein
MRIGPECFGAARPLSGDSNVTEGHKRKKPTPACRCGLAFVADLRLDIPGLLMDSSRFRQPG